MTEYLKKNEFVPYAPDEVGTVHIHHCKDGKDNDRLFITRCEDGLTILAYCHHCGQRGYHNEANTANIQTLKASKASRGQLSYRGGKLPSDCENDKSSWPSPARFWLTRYNITDREVREYGLCYSKSHARVVLPVYDGDGLALYQTRKIFEQDTGPKYLTYNNRANTLWFSHISHKSSTIVLCEDILSGIRLGRQWNAAAVLGTTLTDKSLNLLVNNYSRFIIFMDDDNPDVRMKQLMLKNRLDMFGETTIIHSNGKDAKEHTDEELREVLDELETTGVI